MNLGKQHCFGVNITECVCVENGIIHVCVLTVKHTLTLGRLATMAMTIRAHVDVMAMADGISAACCFVIPFSRARIPLNL